MRPEWMQLYMHARFDLLDVKTTTGTTLASYDGEVAALTNGEVFERAAVLWTAGVKVSSSFPDGSVVRDGKLLFMASYNAAQERKATGRNVLRELAADEPQPFSARKYGFVIPLAQGIG